MEAKGRSAMNRTKCLCYFGIVGLCCLGLRIFLKPDLATPVSAVIGCIIAIIGIILIAIEQSLFDGKFFYAYGNNWKGAGIVNGSCILGISIFFLSVNAIVGVIALLFGSIVISILAHKTTNAN